jgi:hypothetical protein
MALTFVKRSSIPASVKGKVATAPAVSVGSNGQIQLNTLASKHFNGDLHFAMANEGGKIYMFPKGSKLIAKVADSDLFEFKVGKKTKTLFFSATNFLRSKETFGEAMYDFAKSGNQTFSAVIDEKSNALIFELPKGSLTPKPIVPRKKKEKVAGTAATPVTVPATTVETEELVLE